MERHPNPGDPHCMVVVDVDAGAVHWAGGTEEWARENPDVLTAGEWARLWDGEAVRTGGGAAPLFSLTILRNAWARKEPRR